MDEEKDAFAGMEKAVGDAARGVTHASDDIAACVPAFRRLSNAMDRLRASSLPLRPVAPSEEDLLACARMLVERSQWHIKSASRCIQADGIHKRERFLQAYRQILETNGELERTVASLEARFPGTDQKTIATVRESIRKTSELATRLLGMEGEILFIRTAADGPGPKNPS